MPVNDYLCQVMRKFLMFFLAVLPWACDRTHPSGPDGDQAEYFVLENDLIVSISPFDGSRDSLRLDTPVGNLVCMSSSYAGYLETLGCDSVITAVSGAAFISGEKLRRRYLGEDPRPLYDVGYEAAPDYERLLALSPDLVLTYTVSAVEPGYISRLRALGLRVMILYEHMERSPLARASYLRLFGALTGRSAEADSLFSDISARYRSLVRPPSGIRVLFNLPYGDAWYVPGEDNYMSRLIRDAGAEVLGAVRGSFRSGTVSLEEAAVLAARADFWLHPGGCTSLAELEKLNPLPFDAGALKVYNNNLRRTPEGGNDFWESGAARPDLILQDLRNIFENCDSSLYYYRRLE